MANKIFSINNVPLESNFVPPTFEDSKDTPISLGQHDLKQWFSYNPEKVTLTLEGDNVDVYGMTVYDSTDDADILAEVKENSNYVQKGLSDIVTTLHSKFNQFEYYEGIVNSDPAVLAEITRIRTELDEFVSNLGF